jgi:hypothetical protein
MEPVRQAADRFQFLTFLDQGYTAPTDSGSLTRRAPRFSLPAMTAFPALPALKMARGRIELPTRGFSVLCSAN